MKTLNAALLVGHPKPLITGRGEPLLLHFCNTEILICSRTQGSFLRTGYARASRPQPVNRGRQQATAWCLGQPRDSPTTNDQKDIAQGQLDAVEDAVIARHPDPR